MRKTSKPEPKELEHGVRVIADRIFTRIPMLFISKPDRIVARHRTGFQIQVKEITPFSARRS